MFRCSILLIDFRYQIDKWQPREWNRHSNAKYSTFHLELASELARCTGANNCIALIDVSGFALAHTDSTASEAIRDLINLLEKAYYETIGIIYIIGSGLLFNLSWRAIQSECSFRTHSRIRYIESNQVLSTLSQFVSRSVIPKAYGGGGKYDICKGSWQDNFQRLLTDFQRVRWNWHTPSPVPLIDGHFRRVKERNDYHCCKQCFRSWSVHFY